MSEVITEIKAIDGHTFGKSEEMLAKDAADALNRHYPGHLWAVNVNADEKGGVMTIKNFSVSFKYGYTLHLAKLDPTMKRVIKAGGEILERANLARGKSNGEKATHVDGVKDKDQPFMGIIT